MLRLSTPAQLVILPFKEAESCRNPMVFQRGEHLQAFRHIATVILDGMNEQGKHYENH